MSNAGGLGTLSALTQLTPEALSDEIRRCRTLTGRPFGVNVTMLRTVSAPPCDRIFDILVQERVGIVETAGNVPQAVSDRLRQAGITIVHKCTSVRHALAAEKRRRAHRQHRRLECAGHPGEDDGSGLVLIPAAVPALKVPVIASGGIADGRDRAAAPALGAEGINKGTRFVATCDAPVDPHFKQALVRARETDTRLMFRTLRNTARVRVNAVSIEVLALEHRPGGCSFDDLRPLVAGAARAGGAAVGHPGRRRRLGGPGGRPDRRCADLCRTAGAHGDRMP